MFILQKILELNKPKPTRLLSAIKKNKPMESFRVEYSLYIFFCIRFIEI
jgi:hypothetical protein